MSSHAEEHFKGQHEDEHILHVYHRHWFDILVQFIGVFVVTLILIVGSMLFQWVYGSGNSPLDPTLLSFLSSTLVVFIWFFAFFIWIDYWFDIWIITDQRIVNVEQRGLFVREISELNLPKVQDVTSEVVGIIPSILNFGDVFVQTAGEQERFVFHQVPDPNRIKDMLMKMVHEASGDEDGVSLSE